MSDFFLGVSGLFPTHIWQNLFRAKVFSSECVTTYRVVAVIPADDANSEQFTYRFLL